MSGRIIEDVEEEEEEEVVTRSFMSILYCFSINLEKNSALKVI